MAFGPQAYRTEVGSHVELGVTASGSDDQKNVQHVQYTERPIQLLSAY